MKAFTQKISTFMKPILKDVGSILIRRKRYVGIVTAVLVVVLLPSPSTALDTSYTGGHIFLTNSQILAYKALETNDSNDSFSSEDFIKPDVKKINIVPDSYIKDPKGNEQIIWNYLIDQGFSDEQAAGIMGNFWQEHHFRTDGDGLAQWMGGRKKNLYSRPDAHTVIGQLNFMMHELNGGYINVRNRIYNCTTVEQATLAFMRGYERPGIPATEKRLSYAHIIYNKYHKG